MRLGVVEPDKVKLQPEGGRWRIVPSQKRDPAEKKKWDGSFKLVNVDVEREKEMCLDWCNRLSETEASDAGQRWMITPIETITAAEFMMQ